MTRPTSMRCSGSLATASALSKSRAPATWAPSRPLSSSPPPRLQTTRSLSNAQRVRGGSGRAWLRPVAGKPPSACLVWCWACGRCGSKPAGSCGPGPVCSDSAEHASRCLAGQVLLIAGVGSLQESWRGRAVSGSAQLPCRQQSCLV